MITFQKVRWKNFLSTGNNFSEVNLQAAKTNLIVGSNGAGKSTILDALTFGLFGKSFRKINKPSLVNSINEKDCLVEIEFSIGKNQYLVRRGIKPNVFEIYVNSGLWNQESTVVDQQKNFEQNVLKMNYKSFTQVVILGSSTFVPFMRLPLGQRREIIEDILDIQIFSVMNDNLRDKVRENSEELKSFEQELSIQDKQIEMQKSYMLDIEKRTKSEIERKQQKIAALKGKKSSCFIQIKSLQDDVVKLNSQMKLVSDTSSKIKKLNSFRAKIQQKVNHVKKETQFFMDNHTCPTCTQEITQEFRNEKIEKSDNEWKKLNAGLEDIEKSIAEEESRESEFLRLSEEVMESNNKISQINYEIQSISSTISEIASEIEDLNNDSPDKKLEFEKLEALVNRKKENSKQISFLKKDKDLLTTASVLLKDSGIKTRIIKTYLPTMNKLINQYLQSMDFYVNFTLDENFEETIKSRHRDIFSYESFSEGEKSEN